MACKVSSVWTVVGFAGLAAALLALDATPVAAQSAQTMTKEQAVQLVFKRFDGNGDGNISNAEFLKVGEQDFKAFDADKDGSVSKEEFLDPKPRRLGQVSDSDLAQAKKIWARQFDMLDTDKNGALSEAEHEKAGKRSFSHIDKNKDGEITMAEMTAVAK
jgi:Ca2+-binding EF-hand superfamily protein